MNLIEIIEFLGIPGVIIGILVDFIIAYVKNKTSYSKRLWAWIINKSYKIRLNAIKKYNLNEIDIKTLERNIINHFAHVNIVSRKKNSIIVLIEDMQAPYKILITTDEMENSRNINIVVEIILIGNVKFRYRESDNNDKFFNILEELFDIIEVMINEKSIYSFFTLQADFKNEFKKRPFVTSHNKEECENTKLDLDKDLKFLKINSRSKDNLHKCLKKNIYKIL